NLRNEDFRKLLTQKRTEAPKTAGEQGEKPKPTKNAAFSHKQANKQQYKKKGGHGHKHKKEQKKKEEGEEAEEEEDDEERLKEIMKNYRDRAAERRTKGDEPEMDPQLAAAYRAVPGDRRAVFDQATKRQQAIDESKYLGGDMEHTHLVKGLDYSLLHKVRAEITKTRHDGPIDEDEELEAATRAVKSDKKPEEEKQPESLLARNVQRILFKNEIPHRNELFGKGRMAYVVELDDESSDVPTTLLRSLHDCPVTDSNATVNANNMLIGKLTQVLSYLRTDTKKGKGRQARDDFVTEEDRNKAAVASIYDDAGEYVPRREKEERREKEGEKREKRDYFGEARKDKRDDRQRDERDKRKDTRAAEEKERDKRRADEKDREELCKRFDEQKRLDEKLAKRKRDTEGYDECYPGGLEMGGFGDSDDEEEEGPASKKGRSAWGDDDKEKFSKASRNTEVKAAYQFGVKKGDGRKSGKQQDKKLDQDLDKINKLMEKRKTEGKEAPKIRY
ncbi:hypothetical protein PENTCL1PPCAC_10132, partial [Pristionchus entomophagus]